MEHLPYKLFLAPMAEISTPALRRVIKGFCSEVVLFSEMLSAGAIVSRASHNDAMTQQHDFDAPLVYQIVGASPDVMAEACRILSEKGCFAVDINMGCPNYEIVKKGGGSRLLADFQRAQKIVQACRKTSAPRISVKMRSGFEEYDEGYFLRFIKMLEQEGVDFITLHPRYAKLAFKRSADWRLVKLAKDNLSIPVIGNGDITTPVLCQERLKETGCDAIMIGRAAVKSPWIFRLAGDLIAGREGILEVNIVETFMLVLESIALLLPRHLHRSRGHRFCYYYCCNSIYSHEMFTKIRRLDSIHDIQKVVVDYYSRNSNEAMKKYILQGGHIYENSKISA